MSFLLREQTARDFVESGERYRDSWNDLERYTRLQLEKVRKIPAQPPDASQTIAAHRMLIAGLTRLLALSINQLRQVARSLRKLAAFGPDNAHADRVDIHRIDTQMERVDQPRRCRTESAGQRSARG